MSLSFTNPSAAFAIEAEVQFDAAHRVPDHASKCKNMHGHRYRVLATVAASALGTGAETGMVMDFGFLKRMMTTMIHDNCDHGTILYYRDSKMLNLALAFMHEEEPSAIRSAKMASMESDIESSIEVFKCWRGVTSFGNTYIIGVVPTAENLAKHWFDLLQGRIESTTQGRGKLIRIDVFETPTSKASYPYFTVDLNL